MITLYTFGPAFGLPDPSMFVLKAHVLLKMAGLDYQTDTAGLSKAPKGKLPYLNDDGKVIADSSFIRMHLESAHGVNFDPGLNREQLAYAFALEKLCEDQLYWAAVRDRWLVQENFDMGPRKFFDSVPAPMRPFVMMMVRRQVRRDLHGQGFARHSEQELLQLATKALTAISDALGDRDFIMGEEPCGADASIWAAVTSILCPHFETDLQRTAQADERLVAYRDRGMYRWFPEAPNYNV